MGEPARERHHRGGHPRPPSSTLLAGAARAPRFARALARLVAELEARRVEPGRFTSGAARRGRRAADSRRAALRARSWRRLYGGYRERARAPRPASTPSSHAVARARRAAARRPSAGARTPVFCYGFDDLEPLQLDAIETLAHRVDAPVTLSLPGEPGRVALAGRAATLETLRPGAEEVIELPPLDAYYEDATLHHLERSLFEDAPDAGARRAARCACSRAATSGPRPSSSPTEIAELVAAGCAPRDIAVVTRGALSASAS